MAVKVMFQGTSSNVGKSILATALCRILNQDGYRVVPFKAQNMALNSCVTADGGEMGRAQVVQAEAAGLAPQVEMNPILLKPTGQATSQVILMGKPIGNLSAKEYHLHFNLTALETIQDCLNKLDREFEAIVIEGAGSPVEVNLKPRDIVNMRVAKMAQAPVLLVADIDRGGAIAAIVGTLALLDEDEQDMVAGIIINKFRGDLDLLRPALAFIEERTGKPVLGVVPYYKDLHIQQEDSVVLDEAGARQATGPALDIAVIALPHISNFTDFDALEDEPDVSLRYVRKGQKIGHPDLVIIPGSKNTIADLLYLRQEGFEHEIADLNAAKTPVIGICGGYQILGKKLSDPHGMEAGLPEVAGLGLLDAATVFEPQKVTTLVEAEIAGAGPFFDFNQERPLTGYEIHMGNTSLGPSARPAFTIRKRLEQEVCHPDGAVSAEGLVFGTYLHGIFDNDALRRHWLNLLRCRRGWEPLAAGATSTRELRERDYNRLADLVRGSLDMAKFYQIIGLSPLTAS